MSCVVLISRDAAFIHDSCGIYTFQSMMILVSFIGLTTHYVLIMTCLIQLKPCQKIKNSRTHCSIGTCMRKKILVEIECLLKAKHKNIVRFLGYYSDTKGNTRSYENVLWQMNNKDCSALNICRKDVRMVI